MQELFIKLRKLPADARGAIDALGASVQIRVIGIAERAVKYRQGLLQRLESQRAAALAVSGEALAGNSTSRAFSSPDAGSGIIAPDRASEDGTARLAGSPARNRDNAEVVAATGNLPLVPR